MSEDADLLVVGAGTAGLPVAIEAARAGLRVELVDAADDIGGTLRVSAGHMSAAGTRRQRQAGIDDDPDRHFADVMRIGHHEGDAALIRLAVDEAPGLVDWLDENGFPFAPGTPVVYHGHSPYSRPRTYWGVAHGQSIRETLRPLLDEQVAAGNVTLRLRSRAVELTTGGGAVTGAVVQTADGPRELRAGVTVLASGGYGANPGLFAALTPGNPRLVTNAVETSTGDAIEMASPLGAVVRFAELHTPRLGLLERRSDPGRVDLWSALANLAPAERPPREIWVNARGERFTAEDLDDVTCHERVVQEQPGAEFWIVFDEASIDAGAPLVPRWGAERLREEARRGDVAWVADDLPGLARRAGIDPDGLLHTVGAYHRAVDEGADPLGRRVLDHRVTRPPYYAVRSVAALLCSFGGLDVDTGFRVRRDGGGVVPGLYALGEAIGMGATSGAAFCGGMAVTPALAFGRLLGRRLAAKA
ncbi:FAD-dependent oxidoreductase [Micromonospora sp. NPDC023956]|uniref:FAD-dependent oxidoreductase n=1 Tax=Micromonospora sp. NPDC023956 TaxID=3155722 RepID=UPI0033E3F8C3